MKTTDECEYFIPALQLSLQNVTENIYLQFSSKKKNSLDLYFFRP